MTSDQIKNPGFRGDLRRAVVFEPDVDSSSDNSDQENHKDYDQYGHEGVASAVGAKCCLKTHCLSRSFLQIIFMRQDGNPSGLLEKAQNELNDIPDDRAFAFLFFPEFFEFLIGEGNGIFLFIPVPGAAEALKHFMDEGHEVYISSQLRK